MIFIKMTLTAKLCVRYNLYRIYRCINCTAIVHGDIDYRFAQSIIHVIQLIVLNLNSLNFFLVVFIYVVRCPIDNYNTT